jgi:hypothetical protein
LFAFSILYLFAFFMLLLEATSQVILQVMVRHGGGDDMTANPVESSFLEQKRSWRARRSHCFGAWGPRHPILRRHS